jgi:Phosphate transport (Pho88)
MSEGTICVGGLVGRRVLFGSAGSGSDEGGGESQCTDENSESAIAADGLNDKAVAGPAMGGAADSAGCCFARCQSTTTVDRWSTNTLTCQDSKLCVRQTCRQFWLCWKFVGLELSIHSANFFSHATQAKTKSFLTPNKPARSNVDDPPSLHTFCIMSGMVANLAIIFGSMQLGKRLDWEDKDVLNRIRALYLLSNIIVFAIYAYVYVQVQKKNGTSLLPVVLRYADCRSNGVEVRGLGAAVFTGAAAARHDDGAGVRHDAGQERGQGCVYGGGDDGRDAFVFRVYAAFARAEYHADQEYSRE